jgi:hypothetical protein
MYVPIIKRVQIFKEYVKEIEYKKYERECNKIMVKMVQYLSELSSLSDKGAYFKHCHV